MCCAMLASILESQWQPDIADVLCAGCSEAWGSVRALGARSRFAGQVVSVACASYCSKPWPYPAACWLADSPCEDYVQQSAAAARTLLRTLGH